MSSGAALPSLSVVVPTRGRPEYLPPLVEAVTKDPAVGEILVVVDGEDDASTAMLERLAATHPTLRPLRSEKSGQLGALDYGVARARSELVLLLDDDVLPEGHLASGHARHHARAKDLVVMGAMPVRLTGHGNDPIGTRLYAEEYLAHVARLQSGEIPVLEGLWVGNLSMRREDCRRVGLRSDDYPLFYHSDRDLGYRLADAGLTGVYDPSLAAAHLHRRDATAFLRDARRQGAGRVLLDQVHPDRANPERPAEPSGALGALATQAVRTVGASPAATPVARSVLAAGEAAGRLFGDAVEVTSARVARRLMLRYGATHGAG